jgi:hypothetical protein
MNEQIVHTMTLAEAIERLSRPVELDQNGPGAHDDARDAGTLPKSCCVAPEGAALL